MLADEYGTASNIKSRVNRFEKSKSLRKPDIRFVHLLMTIFAFRLSVLGAITSVQHRLKLYTKVQSSEL